jgi:hypothetical protein
MAVDTFCNGLTVVLATGSSKSQLRLYNMKLRLNEGVVTTSHVNVVLERPLAGDLAALSLKREGNRVCIDMLVAELAGKLSRRRLNIPYSSLATQDIPTEVKSNYESLRRLMKRFSSAEEETQWKDNLNEVRLCLVQKCAGCWITCAIGADVDLVLTGDTDGMVYFVNPDTGATRNAIGAHVGSVNAMCLFGTDILVTGGSDGALRVWRYTLDEEDDHCYDVIQIGEFVGCGLPIVSFSEPVENGSNAFEIMAGDISGRVYMLKVCISGLRCRIA